MFSQIERRDTAVDLCERAIREAILRGELRAGERLPPERTLAEQLGVTRVTLRAALGRIAGAGLVIARQGSGYQVQDFRESGGPDLLGGLASLADHEQLSTIVADLLLVRRQLARAVLQRLSESPDADVSDVISAIDAFAGAVEREASIDELADADMGVLRALIAATGSPVLGLCLNPILAVVRTMPILRDTIYGEPATNVAGYRLLGQWLASRDTQHIDLMIAELERRDQRNADQIRDRHR